MVLRSGSHSRSQVSVANPWADRIGDFQMPAPDWLVEIAWQCPIVVVQCY